MRGKKRNLGSDLGKADKHVITPEEYEEIPEWTDEQWERADLHFGGKLVRRGRPRSERPKRQVTLRLDQEVLAALRASGAGWQTRVNAILAKALAKERRQRAAAKALRPRTKKRPVK